MQCNIDARGKAARLIYGIVMIALAVLIGALAWLDVVGPWGWAVAAGLFPFGAFSIYEGWAGWCVVRAMGFKTRM